ncbi:two-component regulator propeller domain-containing protein [Labilibaculum sp.]|uniref:two-component regulator propeller domain-containing protein n=1 Tax=Labilibaculum sp. TaxID=2060723 RepID=UPI002AA71755|nr:two-component regulator propeller domain-containing protein [Labilibaculum sp.]MBN2597420.1 hypothetical protein [Marinifilaceae bacterium]
MTRSKLILFIVGLFCNLTLFSQQNNIRFKRITINEGLSLSSVYCIFQDSKGFMWFGTEDGLNRYDGKNFTIYRSNPENTNSISYKWIEQIIEDNSGNLWFGSRGGLTRFNPVTEIFTQYRGIEPNRQLSNDTITHLFEDHSNRLWIGSLKGITCINTKLGMIEKNEYAKGLNSKINCFLADNNNFWVGSELGLFYYEFEKQSFKEIELPKSDSRWNVTSLVRTDKYLWVGTNNGLLSISRDSLTEDSHNFLSGLHIENISSDSANGLWVATNKALFRKDHSSENFQKAISSFEVTNSLSINTNKPILKSNSEEIWFGTFGSGIYRINPSTNQTSHYTNNSADPQSLSENSINCIYEDRNGIIWIGTFGAGISIYDPQSHKFELLKNNPLSENSLISNFVWSAWEDHNGDLWIGTNNKGISKYIVKRDSFVHYDVRESDNYPYSTIRKVLEDRKNNIWIGTDGEGLFKLNPLTGNKTQYKHIPNDSTSLCDNSVRVIFEDSEGIIWVGTRGGLNRYHEKNHNFTQYKHIEGNTESLSNNFIYSTIYEDSKGLLWIGTYGGGLNIYDKKTNTFKSYQYNENTKDGLSDNVVFSVYEDINGKFWLGTNNKLNCFDAQTGIFSHFGTKEGLPNNVIYGILPDNFGNLWLSTNNGICRFSTQDYSVKNFTVDDGLQSKEFNGGAFHRGKSGKLYFGGVYGLNVIDPNLNLIEERRYNIVLTKLEIHGQEVLVDHSTNKNSNNLIHYSKETDSYYLKKSIAYTDSIELDYDYRFFSIEFSSLSSYSSDKINYTYRLQGLEQKWVNFGNRNYVSYSNLSPGEYIFQVKAQNQDGQWSEHPKELFIEIFPPFYLTWWFILIEIIIGTIITIFIYRFLLNTRTNKLLIQQNERISSTNLQLKELIATKDKFFRIISHDLKNPFTSLLSISEMIQENYDLVEDEEKRTGIQKIHESVKHIYTLLENLLTWSKSQTNKIDFHAEIFNLTDLVEQSICLYKASADKKEIKIVMLNSEKNLAFADQNMCSLIVRNLINNAIKFSEPKSQIEIDIQDKNDFLEVQIIDHGIGIAKENIDKLFRIDLKYKSTGTAGEKGTGLGLLLCKEFAEANGGKIWVESTFGEGSTFYLRIPQSK